MPKRRQRHGEDKEGHTDVGSVEEDDNRKPAARPRRPPPSAVAAVPTTTTSLSCSTQPPQEATAHRDGNPNNKCNNNENNKPPLINDRVTPHMERLLRLISEGTTSSAQMAAGQLTQLTRQSSAIVLWQVLGRLQTMLIDMDSWKARQNAALAMEGVAANLPVADQVAFFRHDHHAVKSDGGDSDTKEKEDCPVAANTTTLRMADISVSMILQQGQELYAAAPSKYIQQQNQAHEKALEQLDQDAADFVQERIQKQRRILAQRLGLATVSEALRAQGKKHATSDSLGDLVSNEDIVASYQQKDDPTRKRPRVHKEEQDVGIQQILVQEMKKAAQGSTSASHRDPQHLLANELIYRMFDSVWQRRHGGLLGILALLKAWRKTVSETLSRDKEGALFGPWPEDILARSICLLTLDRFGDFSGAGLDASDTNTSNITRQKSGGVVAPIRELGGQLVSVLWRMAPIKIQQKSLGLFVDILEATEDWESQHGILLALKYITVVEVLERGQEGLSEAKRQWTVLCLETCGTVAGRFLCSTQDVACVAAQILREYPIVVLKERSILEALWRAVRTIDGISSCASDMISLLSSCVQSDANKCISILANIDSSQPGEVAAELVSLLLRFLDSPFGSVRTATLRSLELLATAEASKSTMWLARGSKDLYCATMNKMFSCYVRLADESTLLTEDEVSDLGPAFLQLDKTWRSYCVLCSECQMPVSSFENLLLEILDTYFYGPDLMSRPTRYHVLTGSPCSAVSILISHLVCRAEIKKLFLPCLRGYLRSPWIEHCELACGLLKEVAQIQNEALVGPMVALFPLVSSMLETMPLCLQVAKSGCSAIFDQKLKLKHKENVRAMRFVSSPVSMEYPNAFGLDDINAMIAKHGYILRPVEYAASDLDSMRLKATAASAALRMNPPQKLTPFVRALMTSMKSETANSRLEETASALTQLLVDSHKKESHFRARKKILNSLSKIITEPRSRTAKSSNYAASAVATYLSLLPPETLESTMNDFEFHQTLRNITSSSSQEAEEALVFLDALSEKAQMATCAQFFLDTYAESLCRLSCRDDDESLRARARSCVKSLCTPESGKGLAFAVSFASNLIDKEWKKSDVLNGCLLLKDLCALPPSLLGRFVKPLLPLVLKSMTHPDRTISGVASGIFAVLVRLAPLVDKDSALSRSLEIDDDHTSSVIDHLICGKPLPQKTLPAELDRSLREAGVKLRDYQVEGISWLSFLMSVNLNGALCDSMGLGKTIQALVGIALGHSKYRCTTTSPKSIVVCPATIVNHWVGEVRRFFPSDDVFRPCAVLGDTSARKTIWGSLADSKHNLVVLSYSTLRTDIQEIERVGWVYCVLDEGHVLRNPKTATAIASRRIPSKHRIVLSGTMIQNKVLDVWATFDFLMPNFLGSAREFSHNFAGPITKSQLPGATADCIREGMEKLRLLHQQVLPFILRREKDKVLRELPAKNIIDLRCPLSALQRRLYDAFASSTQAKESIALFESTFDSDNDKSVGSKILRVLLFLRLICTHPRLADLRNQGHVETAVEQNHYRLSASGKFMALSNLLRDCGLNSDGLFAGDNDDSLLHCDADDVHSSTQFDSDSTLRVDEAPLSTVSPLDEQVQRPKCLIFAQFAQTLDAIEDYLFKPHMPSLRYLRLDGSVPPESRVDVANRFNIDRSISVLLLTTRVGSLGLNLTGASIVIFMEHDFNPFVDEQAMDRVHRIGQRAESVTIYRLVAEETIDEKIMDMQKKKIAMSRAVVNTENSTLYSMGTDRLLDIFTPKASNENESEMQDLDAIMARYARDYESLSIDQFIRSFQS